MAAGQQQRQARQSSSSARKAARLGCVCLLVAAACLSSGVAALPSPEMDLDRRQLASSADADGNTVVYSVGTDDTGAALTTTLETVPAGAATTTATTAATTAAADTATDTAAGGNVGVGAGDGNAGQSVNLGQQTASPTSKAPATTFLAYTTVGGQQITLTMTFVASTPTTPPPTQPLTGSVLAYTDYVTAVPTTSSTGGAVSKKLNHQNGQVAAFGLLLSMLVGALMVL